MYDYKRYANIGDTDNDGKISAAFKAAVSLTTRYTGVTFSNAPKTVKLNPSSDYLILPDTNVSSITSITLAAMGEWDEDNEVFSDLVLDSENYYLDFAGVVELIDVVLPKVKRSITVEYVKDSLVPDDLKLAIYELTQYYFKREFNYSKTVGSESIDFNDSSILPTQVKTILDMHRCL